MHNKPTVSAYTLGCKVNQFETQAILEAFETAGFEIRSFEDACDFYIINTCTVTAESDRKSGQFIRQALKRSPDARVMVCGCFSQVSPERVTDIGNIAYIGGNKDKLAIVKAAVGLLEGKDDSRANLPEDIFSAACIEPLFITKSERARAYVKVQDGCESACAYCIIPKARGKIRSANASDVIDQIRTLVGQGYHEIIITGIEISAYGKDLEGIHLIGLLELIDARNFDCRFRLGSLDPSSMSHDFIRRYAALRNFVPHFHLSLQSGSDEILRRMRRRYNTSQLREKIEWIREEIADCQLTADIITGFPGESEHLHRETLNFLAEIRLLDAHIFPYSKREGTEAAAMPSQVPKAVAKARLAELASQQEHIRSEILSGLVGSVQQVLVEEIHEGVMRGVCGGNVVATAEFEGCHPEIRRIVNCKITSSDAEKLIGFIK